MAFYPKRPALRVVNAGGSVVTGPVKLWQPDAATQGIYLFSARVEYQMEVLGPELNISYSEIVQLLGYRPVIDLTFSQLLADNVSGVAILTSLYNSSMTAGYSLQFNAREPTCNVWRRVYPTSNWLLEALKGKDRAGYELNLSLRANDLIAAVPDWTTGAW